MKFKKSQRLAGGKLNNPQNYKEWQSTRHPILWFISVLSMFGAFEDEMSERFTDSPLMASLGLCCGSAGSGSRPWPASGPSPAWTGPPYHEGCTCSSAAAQGAQRTCIWGHSPMTSLLAPLTLIQQATSVLQPVLRAFRAGQPGLQVLLCV